jgi:hypothetical protein
MKLKKEFVNNITGCILQPLNKLSEDFKIRGLLMPKDEVSRNGVLYDWDSVKKKAKEFEGLTVNYNHIIDDDKKPIGKILKTWVKEKEDDEGCAGLYYEAQIDDESEYASSIKKGYLNKVSLQVTADAQKSEEDENGERYTRAFIGSPLEVSVVKVPGFNQTTMEVALAEAFRQKNKNNRSEDKKDNSDVDILLECMEKEMIMSHNLEYFKYLVDKVFDIE